MSKLTVDNYSSGKEILRVADHFVAIPVTVSDSGVVAVDGKKVVKAGTVVGGSTKSIFEDKQEAVITKNTALLGAEADGVLLNDVDVTYGANAGSLLVHGFVSKDKLPEAVVAEAKTALKQIQFI